MIRVLLTGIRIILVILYSFRSTVLGQVQLNKLDSLTLEQAVKLALEHHPSLRAAAANLESASSGLTVALAGYYPSVIGSASFSRTDGAFVLNPTFPPRNQSYNTYTTGVQMTETVFDFGKTIGKVSANSDFVNAASADQEATRQTVIMNAQLAYFSLIQAKQVIRVNEEALDQAKKHLAQAKAFYSVGRRPQSDVTKAEVDLANADVNLIRARNQMRLARVSLENTMGVHPTADYRVREVFEVPPFSMRLDSAEVVAFQERPELIAAHARVEANRSLVSATWDQHLPTIGAFGNWTWSNFDFPLFSRWNAGLTFTLPIFQGFAISAQVDQARAAADVALANLDLLNETARLEVEQNYLGLKEAEDRIGATAKLLEQAEENLRLANGEYAAGVGTPIEVADAQLSLSNAQITRIQALSDYNGFLIRLQRSMGILGRRKE